MSQWTDYYTANKAKYNTEKITPDYEPNWTDVGNLALGGFGMLGSLWEADKNAIRADQQVRLAKNEYDFKKGQYEDQQKRKDVISNAIEGVVSKKPSSDSKSLPAIQTTKKLANERY